MNAGTVTQSNEAVTQATVPQPFVNSFRIRKKSAKEILLEKTNVTASGLTLTEKNIVLDDFPNPDNNARLFKTNIDIHDNWINYVITSIRDNREPYKQNRRNVLPATQTQLHHTPQ